MKNNKGFSMVELLVVITVLGIIASVSVISIQGVLSKARDKYYIAQENDMVMAARSYLEMNKEYLPKVSGQETKVSLKDLIDNKYIDKVLDYNKNECYTEDSSGKQASYVRVFKFNDEYIYSAYLFCPNHEKGPVSYGQVNLDIQFQAKDKLENAQAKLSIEEIGKSYGIVYYSYTIYKDNVEVFSQKFEQKKYSTPINIVVPLKDYVPGKIKVVLTATNIYGISKTIDEEYDSSYIDPKIDSNNGDAPSCLVNDEDKDKNRLFTEYREIKVGCKDEKDGIEGLGCSRNTYTKRYTTDTVTDEIRIDNRFGFFTNCVVLGNNDVTPPSITLNFYKRTVSGDKTGSSLGTIKIDPYATSIEHATVTREKDNVVVDMNLEDIIREHTEGWLNAKNYPRGLYIDVEYTDASGISSIDWKTNSYPEEGENNEKLIASREASNYTTLVSNGESKSYGKDVNRSNDQKGFVKGNVGVSFVGEGYRYGELVVKDMMLSSDYSNQDWFYPHKITVRISTKIDRTSPTMPDVSMYKWNNNTTPPTSSSGLDSYTEKVWTNKYVFTKASNSMDFLSGFNKYQYITAGAIGTANIVDAKVGSGYGYLNINKDGQSSIRYSACDKAGNCSDYTSEKEIWVDTAPPEIKVLIYNRKSGGGKGTTLIRNYSATSTGTISLGWINENYMDGVYIDMRATDNVWLKDFTWGENADGLVEGDRNVNVLAYTTTEISGTNTKQYNTYKEITKDGYRVFKVKVTDQAGNEAVVDMNIPLDRVKPLCNITGQASSTSDWKNSRTLTINCTDGMSGCTSYTQTFNKRNNNLTIIKDKSFIVKDEAGNETVCKANIYLDTVPPVCVKKSGDYPEDDQSSWTKDDRTVQVHCKEDDGSGCTRTDAYPLGYTISSGDYEKYSEITIADKAGNETDCDVNVYIDKKKPSCDVSGDGSSWKKSRNITVDCSDGGSGCTSDSYYDIEYSPRKFTTSIEDDSRYIKDKAGNGRWCYYDVYVDVEPPIVHFVDNPYGGQCAGAAGVRGSYYVEDKDSGLDIVGDWWGNERNSYDITNIIDRSRLFSEGDKNFRTASSPYNHFWSSACYTKNQPKEGVCYYLKVYAEDVAGNVTSWNQSISSSCSYISNAS